MSTIFKINPNTKVPAEQRQLAYENMLRRLDTTPLISWGEELMTVDTAVKLYMSYFAEGDPKAAQLQTLIVEAKAYIRSIYPDVSEEVTA